MTDVLIEPTAPRFFESGGIATAPAIGSRNFSPQD